jgi:hypothetical protein
MFGHTLTTHTYQSIEAIDPYITTQADDIHTIARHMDNQIESKQSTPKVSTLNKPPTNPYMGIRKLTTGILRFNIQI